MSRHQAVVPGYAHHVTHRSVRSADGPTGGGQSACRKGSKPDWLRPEQGTTGKAAKAAPVKNRIMSPEILKITSLNYEVNESRALSGR